MTTTNSGASDTQYTVRRQFVGTTNSSGVVTFNAQTNETFTSHAEKDYTMSILTAGSGSGSQGDIVSIADTISGDGTASIYQISLIMKNDRHLHKSYLLCFQ